MIKSKLVYMYLLLATLIVVLEWIPLDDISPTTLSKEKVEINQKDLDLWKKQYDENKSSNEKWGLPKGAEEFALNTLEDENTSQQVQVSIDQQSICINKSCYRLLGIKMKTQEFAVVLYNINTKEKITEYYEGDLLEHNISVNQVLAQSVKFINEDTQEDWKLEIFDVNETKYIPKDIDEN